MNETQAAPWMYERMYLSRYYEECMEKVYMEGKTPRFNMANGPVPGEMHLSSGQEPCAVGVCAHLGPDDYISAPHRAHHIAIAKGVDLRRMTAEMFGKKEGLSGGRGGHMHLFDRDVNFSCSGIIASGCGPAVGAALSFQMRRKSHVAISYVGEGAVNQGGFHESCNLAALWKLPVIFVIEDNGWGVSVSKAASTAIPRNDIRAVGYGMPGYFVADNDPLEVYKKAGEAIARARSGGGPSLFEIQTYRLAGHFMGDAENYRPKQELEELKRKDPIQRLKSDIVGRKLLTEAELSEIEARARAEVDAAFKFARDAAFPAPEEALDKVFV